MRAVSLAARHQHDEKVGVIGRPVRIRLDQGHLRQGNDALGHLLRQLGGFVERGAFGKRVGTDQFGLVVGGNPVASHQMIETECGKKSRHTNQDNHAPVRQGPI